MSGEKPQPDYEPPVGPDVRSASKSAELAASLQRQLESQGEAIPKMIGPDDIHPNLPKVGGTLIVLERHGKYIRDKSDESLGSLTPEAAEAEEAKGVQFMRDIFAQMPVEECSAIDVLIVASDTSYEGGGRRSYETAQAIQRGMTAAFESAGLGPEHILNNIHPVETPEKTLETGVPWAMPSLREPRMSTDRRFGAMLAAWYPDDLEKMIAFEEDRHVEERLAMGGEGPGEIADRTLETIDLLNQLAVIHHAENPDRRLVVWAASHYDTISPLVKLKLAGGAATDVVQVAYGGGISIDIGPDNHATSTIAGVNYEVPLTSDAI
jgi:hypothetical protein